MATEKTLNTIIKHRIDTLANWSITSAPGKGANLVLRNGELGICVVPADQTAVSGDASRPQYLMKIGDGSTAFKDLPWLSAKAADVYAWAKGESKPSYTAEEVGAYTKAETGTQITNAINALDSSVTAEDGKALSSITITNGKITDHTEVNLGDIDTNTQFQLVQNSSNGHQIKLQKKEKGETSWTDVTSWLTIPDNNTTYTFASGNTPGAFSVTPSGGSAQTVSIYGLGGAAYVDTLSDVHDSAGVPNGSAVMTYVEGKISDLGTIMTFVGTVATETALKALTNVKKGSVYVVTADGSEWVATADIGTTASASSWEKFGTTDVKNALYKDNNTFTNNYLLKADGTAGKVKAVPANASAVGITVSASDGVSDGTNTYKYDDTYVLGEITTLDGYISDIVAKPAYNITSQDIAKWDDAVTKSATSQQIMKGSLRVGDTVAAYSTISSSGVSTVTYSGDSGTYIEPVSVRLVDNNGSAHLKITADIANSSGNKVIKVPFTDGTLATTADVNAVGTRVTTLEGKPGLDKVGTVTSVSASTGLKITGTASVNPTVAFDDSVIFVLDGGTSTANI